MAPRPPAQPSATWSVRFKFVSSRLTRTELQLCDPLPCDVIIDILDDLVTLPMATPDYGTILRKVAAVCSTFVFYSCGESNVSFQLRDYMAVDTHNITM
eukprot:jgi/Tetstr1/465906/TSEL_010522.t1